jgi:diguanylate cyclase (GGDEF)-like protein
MDQPRDRPSFLRPSLFSFTWIASVALGLCLLVWSVRQLTAASLEAMGPPLAAIAIVIVLSELRPVVMSRLVGNPVSISLAFVFATMYVWGLAPALLLMAVSVTLAEILQHKPWWKPPFNVGQYVLSVAAAWLVMVAAGATPSPLDPQTTWTLADVWWIVGSWAVYHVVNLALVAGLAASGGQTWWESFSEEFWFYTVSVVAVLALSPLIAVVAVSQSWVFLPLLLLPLLAVQKAAEMSREKEHQALHDPLTGLPNRLLLGDRIEQALARSTRETGRVAVLFLDLDMFKVVNDSLGHAAGDGLLVHVGRRLESVLRPGDTLARFGGDEFVIVCENVPMEDVERLARRTARALRDPYVFEGRDVNVSVSIGIAVSGDDTDSDTMLRDADAALYRAKEGGRNRAVVFDEAMHQQASARLDAELGLRRALDNGELRVHYQPVVTLEGASVVGFEALVRWDHPERGVVGPDEFVAVAEETGLILPLGIWVLEQAAAQVRRWRDEIPGGADLWMAVNVSPRQLHSPQFVDALAHTIALNRLPASAVRLEIIESALVEASGPQMSSINRLRALGVSLAVDDFGTGYSSLAYLTSLPVSTVKIDRSFIHALGGVDPTAEAIVDAILGMARALRLEVIAEGVETIEQLEALRALGVPLGQGFLWSRPRDASEMATWAAAHTEHTPLRTT